MIQNKNIKIFLMIIFILLAFIIAFVIYSFYDAEKFFFKYNKLGDKWNCEKYGIVVTYDSGEVSGRTWFSKTVENEKVTAKIDGVNKVFTIDFGSGHQKNFDFCVDIDDDNLKMSNEMFDDKEYLNYLKRYGGQYTVISGNYKFKDPNTCIVTFNDNEDNVMTEYWKEVSPDFLEIINSITSNNEELIFKKVT